MITNLTMSSGRYYYTYTAVIYQHMDNSSDRKNIFDVGISISDGPIDPITRHMRTIVYRNIIKTKRYVKLAQLTKYMSWKFSHCQYSDVKSIRPMRHNGCFSHINHDLDWIKSIVDVEFDYHIGKLECKLTKNIPYADEYRKSRFSGYGPQFCDIKNPENNISNSMLAKIFPN